MSIILFPGSEPPAQECIDRSALPAHWRSRTRTVTLLSLDMVRGLFNPATHERVWSQIQIARKAVDYILRHPEEQP
jgi:hypothetical protein